MIIDFSSGAMRRHHVAAGAFAWTSSFSAFGEAVAVVVTANNNPMMVTLGRMMKR